MKTLCCLYRNSPTVLKGKRIRLWRVSGGITVCVGIAFEEERIRWIIKLLRALILRLTTGISPYHVEVLRKKYALTFYLVRRQICCCVWEVSKWLFKGAVSRTSKFKLSEMPQNWKINHQNVKRMYQHSKCNKRPWRMGKWCRKLKRAANVVFENLQS